MFEMFVGHVFKVMVLENEGNALYKVQMASGAIIDHVHGRFLTFLTSSVRRTGTEHTTLTSSYTNDDADAHGAPETP